VGASLNDLRSGPAFGGGEGGAPITLRPGSDPVTCSGRAQRRQVDCLPHATKRDILEMSEYQVIGHTISEYGSITRVNYFFSPRVLAFLDRPGRGLTAMTFPSSQAHVLKWVRH
jgi:hypothetical protein